MQSNSENPSKAEPTSGSVPVPHHATFNYSSYRWVVRDHRLQMLPNSAKRSFNWTYFLSRALGRFRSRRYF